MRWICNGTFVFGFCGFDSLYSFDVIFKGEFSWSIVGSWFSVCIHNHSYAVISTSQ